MFGWTAIYWIFIQAIELGNEDAQGLGTLKVVLLFMCLVPLSRVKNDICYHNRIGIVDKNSFPIVDRFGSFSLLPSC